MLMKEHELTQKVLKITEPILPLSLTWMPKEDITVHELALCLPFLIDKYSSIMPDDVDETLSHFRHFKILNPNLIEL